MLVPFIHVQLLKLWFLLRTEGELRNNVTYKEYDVFNLRTQLILTEKGGIYPETTAFARYLTLLVIL